MNWIKNRFDQLILAVVAVALLIFAAMVFRGTDSFQERFSGVTKLASEEPRPGTIISDPNLPWEHELGAAGSPVWHVANTTNAARDEYGSLFWPGWYIPTKNGPQKPEDAEPLR